MSKEQRLFITRDTAIGAASDGSAPPAGSIPPVLLRQATRRIPLVSILTIAVFSIFWLGSTAFAGDLGGEFTEFFQWGPATLVIVASVVLLWLSRGDLLEPTTLVSVGLVYQVFVSFGLTFVQYWGAFEGLLPDYIHRDRVGLGLVAVWMFAYTVLVPSTPRRALAALIGSATAVPLTYLLSVALGHAPALALDQFALVFVIPYAFVTLMAYLAARTIYGLGEDVRRAREMGSYQLEELLGKGGMGEVWRASHRMLARPAAVKLIRGDAPGQGVGSDHGALVRFEREAQATASLQSAHTVGLYDFGTAADGTLYYVMELLDGVDLDQVVKKWGPLAPERVVHILRQVCASLHEAHSRGLVHRDIKPANLYLCRHALEYDFVKVLDFGLVKGHRGIELDEHGSLSRIGFVIGTPDYLAPEVAMGEEPDGRADIYALGCVAYWLLTGRSVFDEKTISALLLAHAQKVPIPPSERVGKPVPEALERLVLDCLAKDPNKRVSSARELAERLDKIELAEPWSNALAEDWWASHV